MKPNLCDPTSPFAAKPISLAPKNKNLKKVINENINEIIIIASLNEFNIVFSIGTKKNENIEINNMKLMSLLLKNE